ncbi:PIN domain-containing protein [Streptomyces sp. LP05-1]|uniref:PIN domain-containing protein n=1 Tax=Streptomyces pyxinae TaxID=2970734 RepID=A0ABT2CN09_9ACTN|nr:PIN domain-containing protein [Streptomyces sp. LP05-1]MCS0638810.1 PIN domain-containing protein [Streptomyces sp. LP05-1]
MQRVVLDTCVLYPNYLGDALLRLAEAETYEPLWSADILEELRRNVALRPGEQRAGRLVATMADAFPDSCVTGYDDLVPAMGNDVKDRHVLAAAVRGEAHVVVTSNLKDFPVTATEPYEIEVLSPDDFLLDLLDLTPARVPAVLREQVARYQREPRDLHGLLGRLEAGGAPLFAAEIRRRI